MSGGFVRGGLSGGVMSWGLMSSGLFPGVTSGGLSRGRFVGGYIRRAYVRWKLCLGGGKCRGLMSGLTLKVVKGSYLLARKCDRHTYTQRQADRHIYVKLYYVLSMHSIGLTINATWQH